jgi:hypothetical protein
MSRGVVIYDKQSDGRRRANADGWASRPYPSGCGGHDGLAGKKGAPICFCETNPPFFKDFFDVTAHAHVSYDGNVRRISEGSFWKTNPPERVFWGVLGRLEAVLPAKEERRAGRSPYNSGRAERRAWRTRRTSKHVFLRNEPDWKSTISMWNNLRVNELGCESGKFQSGSFGTELRWQPGRLPCNPRSTARPAVAPYQRQLGGRQTVAREYRKGFGVKVTFRHASNADDKRCAETGVDRGGGFARLAALSFSPFSWRSVSAFGRDNTLERIPCTWLLRK